MRIRKENKKIFLIPETNLVADRIEELRDYFAAQLKENPEITHVVMDVRGVDVVDSLGVNLIVGLYRQVTDQSKSIEIIGAGKNFMKIANFFRLTSIFSIREMEN